MTALCIRAFATIAIMCLLTLIPQTPVRADDQSPTDKQIETLMQWWSGEFDNFLQVATESGGVFADREYTPHFRLHGIHRLVDAPLFGAHVMYAAEYKNDDPTTIHSARLQVLRIDTATQAIRLSFIPLRDPKSFMSNTETLEPNLEKLTSLTEADVIRFNPDCDVLLRMHGQAFAGAMATTSCKRGPELYFEYALNISVDGYEFREQARRVSDNSVGWEQAPGSNFTNFEMRRSRPTDSKSH